MRDPQVLYSILEKFPNYVLLPHRLMPYPDSVRATMGDERLLLKIVWNLFL